MTDSRSSLADVMSAFDGLVAAGWEVREIATQPSDEGGRLPIRAYFNAPEVDGVLVSGIHGREPAGPLALARYVERLIEHGRSRALLVMPMLNPWGYVRNERYGPGGQSVSDSDHLLGRMVEPACAEAEAITEFVVRGIAIRPGAHVLDLHEDPVFESPGYEFAGFGSYIYLIGDGAADHAVSRQVRGCLERSSLPLVRQGVTRFNETLNDGAIIDSADGSIDELFARRMQCTPVITVENLLQAPNAPPLEQRVAVYVDVLDAFFGG